MKPHTVLAAAAAAVLAMPGAASASATGQITIGNLTYTLTDLDPNDGVSPSIVFQAPGAGFPPGSVGFDYTSNNVHGGNSIRATGTQPLSDSIDLPGMSLRGSVSGLESPGTIRLDGYASVDQAGGFSGNATTDVAASLGFILSPNTALTVTAVDHFNASAVDYPNSQLDRVTADATITLRNQDGATLQYFADSVFTYGGAPVDRSGQIGGTYANTGTASLTGTLTLDENIWAIGVGGPVSPVPEPGQVAMYAAGLPLLLALRRRSRRDTRA